MVWLKNEYYVQESKKGVWETRCAPLERTPEKSRVSYPRVAPLPYSFLSPCGFPFFSLGTARRPAFPRFSGEGISRK